MKKWVYMDAVYKQVNNAKVYLEVDQEKSELIIRIPYLKGAAQEKKEGVEYIGSV